MELVVDTNCLISALVKAGKSRELICSLKVFLYAPEEIILETINHKKEIIKKSGIPERNFDLLINILLSNIKIIPIAEFKDFKEEALSLVKHPEDALFIALALSRNIPLWSDDKKLKEQNMIKVYSTEELLKILRVD